MSKAATRKDAQKSAWLDPRGRWGVQCYICGAEIPAKATNWGFTWGSDGVFPDGASAMYCCWDCRDFWIDPPTTGGQQS